jgi:hypothetical protein
VHVRREQVHGGAIEGRARVLDAARAGARGQLRVEGLGQLPGPALEQVRVRAQGLGREQLAHAELLELHGRAAGLGRGVHQGQRAPEVALVVAAHLGHEAGLHRRFR